MRNAFWGLLLIGASWAGAGSAQATLDGVRAFDRPFLELVGAIEAPRGYDAITGYAPFRPDRPITEMTIGEVLDWQDRIRAAGAEATKTKTRSVEPTVVPVGSAGVAVVVP